MSAEAPVSPLTSREDGLGPYLRAVARHKLLALAVVAAVVAGTALFSSQRGDTWVASAEVVVSPLSRDDSALIGLQLIRDSGDPTRTVQTAAEVLSSSEVAATTAERIPGLTRRQVEDAVEVEPRGESNVIAISAEADSPERARQIALVYAEAALARQLRGLRASAEVQIERLTARAEELRTSGDQLAAASLLTRVAQLESLRRGRDPTLSLAERPQVPDDPSGPPRWLLLALAGVAGVLLAAGASLLAELVSRRVRDEDELEALYPLPILTQVPDGRGFSPTTGMSATMNEAYRLLAVQLGAMRSSGTTVMVTSPSPGDGKTSSSTALAWVLAAMGQRVLLIDLDLRKPDVARTLGVPASDGIAALLQDEDRTLLDVMVTVPDAPGLTLVTGHGRGRIAAPDALQRRLPDLLARARALADVVIVDTPPLGVISDGLAVARHSDHVLLVVRMGRTDRWQLRRTRDLLERSALPTRGFVVIGGQQGGHDGGYYGSAVEDAPSDRGSRLPLLRSRD